MKKRLVSILLTAGMVITLLSGCSGAGSGDTSTTEKQESTVNSTEQLEGQVKQSGDESIMVVGTSVDFQGIAALSNVGAAGSMQWKEAVYIGLATRLENAGEAVPVMMKSIEQLDNVNYSIEIYDDIYDSDGNHITASDVAFSYNYAKEQGVSQTYQYVGMEVVDDYTVNLEMTSDAIGTLEEALLISVVSQEAFEADGTSFSTKTCGSGAYKITDFVDGSYYVMEKVENWWGNNHDMPENLQPKVDKIMFRYVGEAAQLAIALESGTIDLAVGLTGTETNRFLNDDGTVLDGYSESHYLASLYQGMGFNMDYDSVFYDNLELRQAILYAIDKEAMVVAALNQKGTVCYTLGSENFGDFQDQWKEEDYYNYDQDKAKELLESSGFDTSQTLRIMLDTNETRMKEAQLISAYLSQIGINTEILSYDTALFDDYKMDSSQYDILLDNFYSADYLVSGWAHLFYYENYENGSFNCLHDDGLIEMLVEANTAEGHTDENVEKIHEYLKENAHAVGLIDSYNYVIGREGIGIYINTYKSAPYAWACDLSDDFVSVGM